MTKDSLPLADNQTTLDDLRAEVKQFVSDRAWERYHTPKNLAMSIAIEAAEILEHFQWSAQSEGDQLLDDLVLREKVVDELADVLIYCLSFANRGNIDLSRAVRSKLARNRDRFPVERVLRGELKPEDWRASKDND